MLKCGFVTQRSAYWAWTDELLQRVKSYGFGSILIEHWLGSTQNQDGTYNETKLANGRVFADRIVKAGLTPVIDLRVALYPSIKNYTSGYTTWVPSGSFPDGTTYPDGAPLADWVVNTKEGTERFIDCWKKLIQNYNPKVCSLWHFPGHNGGFTAARDAYMGSWGADVVRRIQAMTDAELIFTLPYQGSSEANGSKSYWLSHFDPLPDDCRVTYGVGHMLFWDIVSNPSAEWDYNLAQVDKDFAGIKKYRDLGKRVVSIEFGGLEYDVGVKPLQSRLDYLNAVCEKMREHNATWTYHCCRPQGRYAGNDNILEVLDPPTFQPDILAVLQKNRFEPTQPSIKGGFQLAAAALIIILLIALSAFVRGEK